MFFMSTQVGRNCCFYHLWLKNCFFLCSLCLLYLKWLTLWQTMCASTCV